jgi:O-antigen/teichoic acid export membrane protein
MTTQPDDLFIQRILGKFGGLSKDMFVYGVGGAFIQVVGLITLPIITRLFTPQEYGTLDLIYQSLGYLSVLLGMNVNSALLRYYYETSADDPGDRRRLVSTAIWSVAGFSLPIIPILSLFAKPFSLWIFDSTEPAAAITLAVFTVPLSLLFHMLTSLQRLERRPKYYIALNFGQTLLNFTLVIILVAVLRVGLIGMFIAQICAFGIGVLAGVFLSRHNLGLVFSWHWMKRLYRYSLPMMPAAFMNWWLVTANRFFLNTYVGLAEVGYYAVAGKIALAMQFMVQTFVLAWEPFMLENLKNPGAHQLYSIALKYYSIGMFAIAAVLSVYAQELFLIVAPISYLSGAGLVAFLVVRYILNGMGYITGVGVAAKEMSIYYSISLLCGVVANTISNVVLTPRFSIYGAAFSETMGIVTSTLVISIISWRLLPIRWKVLPTTVAFMGFAGVSLAAFFVTSMAAAWGWIVVFVIKLVILSIYAVGLALLVERKYLDFMRTEVPRLLAQRFHARRAGQ